MGKIYLFKPNYFSFLTHNFQQIFSDLEKEDAQHDDIPLIKGLLLFHAGNLSFIERTCAQGILAVLRCGKPLQKNLKEASYKKAL